MNQIGFVLMEKGNRMRNHNYPIIFGHKYRKGILALRDGEHGFRFLFCRLNKEFQTGEEFDLSDIESVEQEIWFTDRQALETTVNVMNKVLMDDNEDE